MAMLHKLVQSIFLLLLLTASTLAQASREPGPSLPERARRLEPLIVESANRYGIDARLLRVVCLIESRYRVNAVSPKGARGPMQFMPRTAARYGLKDPHNPKEAIDAAAHYLRDLLARFGGRVDLVLAAYNAGEGTVDSFRTGKPLLLASGKVVNPRQLRTGGIPPYRETQQYVKNGIALYLGQVSTPATSVESHATGTRKLRVDGRGKSNPAGRVAAVDADDFFIEVQ
jgi:soluble lytic murein transglycosylase-like protein